MKRLLIIGAAIAAAACSDRNPVGPTSAVKETQAAEPFTATTRAVVRTSGSEFTGLAVRADGQSETIERGPEHIANPVRFPLWQGMVVFPPRNEPNTFFADLQRLYRDELRRPQSAISYVDPEGQNVWLTEYFRFWLNGCSHEDASSRTLEEIATGATLPPCGAERFDFPPRNLPNEFQGRLEAAYRDVLRRPQMLSYLDSEGANVWLAQYLRFRLNGCGHADAQAKVFTEVRGGGVQPTCNSDLQIWTGAFTASGTFQLSGSCFMALVEEFSNVRLILRPDGTGTFTAQLRVTEGPRINSPATCPDNGPFISQQDRLWQLRWTPVAGGRHFERVPEPGAIHTLEGTATSTGATGTYTLRTGVLGAGGVRTNSATFTLTPAR